MSIKGNQNSATYKKDIVLSFINKFPNATTMAIARLIYEEHKLDFSSLDTVRTNVRRYRGENGKNSSPISRIGERTETQKKQSMSKIIDLPESDYEKCEAFIIPKGQNNILILSDIHFPYRSLAKRCGGRLKTNAHKKTIFLNQTVCFQIQNISRHIA